MRSQQLDELGSVLRRRAFLIVVEINVNAPALCKLQPAAPLIQGIRTVVTAIASSGTVTPHIDVSRSSNPRRGSVVMIRDAKCNVVVAEQIKYVVLVPARMAKLEGVAPFARKEFEERSQPIAILLELRWKLEEHGTGLSTEKPQPRFHQLQTIH